MPFQFTKGTLHHIDNIDHNPSSTTAKDSFHGTGISLFQHPSASSPGINNDPVAMLERSSTSSSVPSTQRIKELPLNYTKVTPVNASISKAKIPLPVADTIIPDEKAFHRGLQHELSWLQSVNDIVVNDKNVTDSHFHGQHTIPTSLIVQFPQEPRYQPYCLCFQTKPNLWQ